MKKLSVAFYSFFSTEFGYFIILVKHRKESVS